MFLLRKIKKLFRIFCISVSIFVPALAYANLKSPSNLALAYSNAIAGGYYTNHLGQRRPLIGNSHDGGDSWSYSASVLFALPSDVGNQVQLNGASCSLLNCVAAGFYRRIIPMKGTVIYPLLASSNNGGDTWIYPSSVISLVPLNFRNGSFLSLARCSGPHCVAAGTYTATNNLQYPLLAMSHNGGLFWEYPETIVSNLPGNFSKNGYFTSATSIEDDFIAAGQYKNTAHNGIPLLSVSHNNGLTWTYPSSIRSNLPDNFRRGGIFNSVTCAIGGCVAAGSYITLRPSTTVYPLIAVSHNRGDTWSYPNIAAVLPSQFKKILTLNQVSCNATNCIAVGQYQTQSDGNQFPFLLSSQDGGDHWHFPQSIIMGLPQDFKKIGSFKGAHCNRNICIAVGEYTTTQPQKTTLPLLASSLDGGVTWIYPASIIAQLPANMVKGTFYATSCNEADCVAVGQHQVKNPSATYYPLVATSHDGGVSWKYPSNVKENLPIDYIDKGIFVGGYSSFS